MEQVPKYGDSTKSMSDSSISSESNYGGADDGTTESALERFHIDLSEKGIGPDLHLPINDGEDDDHSEMTHELKEYALDLGLQEATRDDTINQEAFEDARIWYKKALDEGMPESTELFAEIFTQLKQETKERHKEFHQKQDKWLNDALDELLIVEEEMKKEKEFEDRSAVPDRSKKEHKEEIKLEIKLLKKKMKKVEELLLHEADAKTYRAYKRKIEDYKARLEQFEKEKEQSSSKSDLKKKSKSKKSSTNSSSNGEKKSKKKKSKETTTSEKESSDKVKKKRSKSIDAKRRTTGRKERKDDKKEKSRRSRSVGARPKEKSREKSKKMLVD